MAGELLDEFDRGGLSGGKFAALVAKRKRARAGKPSAKNTTRSGALRRVEAVMPAGCEVHAAPRSEALSVHLLGGMRLEITRESQARLAAALLKALEAVRSC